MTCDCSGWAIQQVMGGLIQKANVSMRKTAGEVFEAAPTISAMGREDDFERITNNEFYLTSLNVTMALAGLGKANGARTRNLPLLVIRGSIWTVCL